MKFACSHCKNHLEIDDNDIKYFQENGVTCPHCTFLIKIEDLKKIENKKKDNKQIQFSCPHCGQSHMIETAKNSIEFICSCNEQLKVTIVPKTEYYNSYLYVESLTEKNLNSGLPQVTYISTGVYFFISFILILIAFNVKNLNDFEIIVLISIAGIQLFWGFWTLMAGRALYYIKRIERNTQITNKRNLN